MLFLSMKIDMDSWGISSTWPDNRDL